jgi:hypothetical protein
VASILMLEAGRRRAARGRAARGREDGDRCKPSPSPSPVSRARERLHAQSS